MPMNLPLDAFARALLFAALSAATTPKSISSDEPPPPPPEVVLWIRPATADEVRLSPETAPELRSLARRGVSYIELAFRRDELLEAVRRLGLEIGAAYFEIPARTGARPDDRGRAIDDLLESLGKPPPVSSEEEAALRRLRAAASDRAARGKGEAPSTIEPAREEEPADSGDGASASPAAGAAESRESTERTPSPEDDLLYRLRRALAHEARLVVLLDDRTVEEAREEAERREIADEVLGVVLSTPLKKGGERPPDRLLLVVLVPDAGPPAAIAAGPSIRRGRVRRETLRAEDIACGLAHSLGLPDSGRPGSSGWVDALRIEPGSEEEEER